MYTLPIYSFGGRSTISPCFGRLRILPWTSEKHGRGSHTGQCSHFGRHSRRTSPTIFVITSRNAVEVQGTTVEIIGRCLGILGVHGESVYVISVQFRTVQDLGTDNRSINEQWERKVTDAIMRVHKRSTFQPVWEVMSSKNSE